MRCSNLESRIAITLIHTVEKNHTIQNTQETF